LPKTLTASLSARRFSVDGATSNGSQNYDLLVVKGSSATETDSLQIELRPDGKLDVLEVVKRITDGGVVSANQRASVDVPMLTQKLEDIVLTIVIGSTTSSMTLAIDGVSVAGAAAQFHLMKTIDQVTWGDTALSEGVGYDVVIDDLMLDVIR
jgi:hypothetical protein